MSTRQKQQCLLALGIFFSLSAISYSFDERGVKWTWERIPFIAIVLLLLAFAGVRIWIQLELERQKEMLLQALSTEKDKWESLLSGRELEVLYLIQQGKRNKEIAAALFIAESTVKTHINNMYKILEVKNRREALAKTGYRNP